MRKNSHFSGTAFSGRLVEKIHELIHHVSRQEKKTMQPEADRKSTPQRLKVSYEMSLITIKAIVWARKKGWIRAEKDNSYRAWGELLNQTFFFCQKNHPDKSLSAKTIEGYLKKEGSGISVGKVSERCIGELIDWINDEIKTLI